MNTVFPVPAPPKKPTLLPLAIGQITSTTLIYVWSKSVDSDISLNAGGSCIISSLIIFSFPSSCMSCRFSLP